DDLIRRIAGKRLIKIGETADRNTLKQLVGDLALVAALVATHEQNALLAGDFVQTCADRIAVHEDVVVVFKKEHADHGHAVSLLFELRQDHFRQDIRNVMALCCENIGDFHSEALPSLTGIESSAAWNAAIASTARSCL